MILNSKLKIQPLNSKSIKNETTIGEISTISSVDEVISLEKQSNISLSQEPSILRNENESGKKSLKFY